MMGTSHFRGSADEVVVRDSLWWRATRYQES
jgi:hypothetical protein